MPTGTRHRFNAVFGAITDAPLTAGAGTFNSPGLADMGVVTAPDHAIVTLDPLKEFGAPEIIIVTVHTAAATVATITRGAYGTTARSHPQGTLWVHAPLDEDFIEILTAATRPTNPYRGQAIFEADTNRYIARSTADVWQGLSMFSDPPAVRLFHSVNQNLVDNTDTTLTFDTEVFDTDSMYSAGSPTLITFTTAGLYLIGGHIRIDTATDFATMELRVEVGGVIIVRERYTGGTNNSTPMLGASTVWKATAGSTATLVANQNNVANTTEVAFSATSYTPIFYATWLGRG